MDGQIIPRSTHRTRGAAAFHAGRPRDSHNMNPSAAALDDWLEGWDKANALNEHAEQQAGVAMEASPP